MEISKALEDLILSHVNLVGDGILAFREGNFTKALDFLNKAVDRDKNDWQARLYLAMSYYSQGDKYQSALHFRYLEGNCPDPQIRNRASQALTGMQDQL